MKAKGRKGLRLLLLGVCLVSTVLLAGKLLAGSDGEDSYDQAARIARSAPRPTVQVPAETVPPQTQPREILWIPEPVADTDPNLEELQNIDLDALRQINPDVIGWILIPDTVIDYPLLQGQDNDYYLKHTWQKKKNAVGSIFMEHRNSADYTDFNTIVYGHNMNNGSMFASLRRYGGEKYWKEHPSVYLVTDEGIFRYDVFSAYRAEVGSTTYGLSFHQEKTRKEFLIHALTSSRIDTGVVPEITDRVLTLSTCSGAGYSTRWVVHARLKMLQQE